MIERVSGTWQGQGTCNDGRPPFDMTLTIAANGISFSGTLHEDVYNTTVNITGTINGDTISFTDTSYVSGNQIQLGTTFTGTVSNGSIAQHTRMTQIPRNAGVYDPYTHTRTRNPYKAASSQEWYEEEDEDDREPVYQTRSPISAVVYRRPYTHVEPVTHTKELEKQPRNAPHPLVYLGVSMLIAVAFIAGYIYIPPTWQRHVDDITYGYPRTFQTDANVGHGGVSHFIVLNLHGTIEVIEVPPNPTKNQPRLYLITQFSNPGADLLPVTVSFIDLNGDGKPDMQVTVYNGTNPTIYILFNDGTTFNPHP